jgi:hypothetical protein
MRAPLSVLGYALILAGCASPYAQVSHVHPHLTGAPGVGSLAAAEQAMKKAMHEEYAKPPVALADCLTALQAESRELERDPKNATAVRDYNFGVARDAVEKRFPKMKPMVVIGHSMGGCISRLLLTDSGNKLWMNIFGRPPDEVPSGAAIHRIPVMEWCRTGAHI